MAREKEGVFDDRMRIDALEDEVVKLRKMVESQLEQCEETGVQMESALRKVEYQLENIEVSCEAARQREVWQRNRERDVNLLLSRSNSLSDLWAVTIHPEFSWSLPQFRLC